MDGVEALVQPPWPPLRHVERGWADLEPDGRRVVEAHLAEILADTRRPDGPGEDARRAAMPTFPTTATTRPE